MIRDKKVIVVMPAYNAAKTLIKTYNEIPKEIVDQVVLVDDFSSDSTLKIAKELNLTVFQHQRNIGYGGSQKTCYKKALDLGADIIVMLHPDYQYDPKLIKPMAELIVQGKYDLVLGSRVLAGKVLSKGMPIYKYLANRFLTWFQNLILSRHLSEYHTGCRAFSRQFLEKIPFEKNSNDFLFDNQILIQAIYFGFKIGEVACPARYTPESSSIKFIRSFKYGIGVIAITFLYLLQKWRWINYKIFIK